MVADQAAWRKLAFLLVIGPKRKTKWNLFEGVYTKDLTLPLSVRFARADKRGR
jgi:hypothetical protein